MKLIRGHPACLLALQLDVTRRISDGEIMKSLAGSSEDMDIQMRERLVPEETIQRILELRREAQEVALKEAEMRRRSIWLLLIRLLLCGSYGGDRCSEG